MKSERDPRYPGYTRKQLMERFSYDDGMAVLPTTFVDKIKQVKQNGPLYTKTKFRSIERDNHGRCNINGRGKYDAVILTITTDGLSSIKSNVRAIQRDFQKLASQVSYAPVSVVVLGF